MAGLIVIVTYSIIVAAGCSMYSDETSSHEKELGRGGLYEAASSSLRACVVVMVGVVLA